MSKRSSVLGSPRDAPSRRPSALTGILVVFASGLVLAAGCRRDPPPPALGATAETIVRAFNELSMREPADVRGVLALFHAETDAHQRRLDVLRSAIPLLELDHAMWARFGRGMMPGEMASPLSPIVAPAILVGDIGHRVSATYTDRGGGEATLFLVRAGDRWWISGHTVARHPVLADDGMLDRLERMSAVLGPFAPQIAAGVRAGQFGSVEEVGVALGHAAAAANPGVAQELADNPGRLFGAGGA